MSDTETKIALFEGIRDPSFVEEMKKLPQRRFPRGMIIFDQDEKSEEVYVIFSGSVEIVRQHPDHDLARIALLTAGELFGEFSYLTGTPRSTAALAMEGTVVLELSPLWLNEAHRKFPEIRERLDGLYRSRVLANILRGTKIFASLKPEEVAQLAGKMSLRSVSDREVLIKEGATDLDLIVVKRGRIAITKKKGNDTIALGEVGSGDILGEMAVITGEPRSASAVSLGEAEIMILPGTHFQEALHTYPSLLAVLEDVVRSRAAQTRQALETVLSQIIGEAWTDVDPAAGILVESVKVHAAYSNGEVGGEGALYSISRTHWTLNRVGDAPEPAIGSTIQLSLASTKVKELQPLLAAGPLTGTVQGNASKRVSIELDASPAAQDRIAQIVTLLARARFKLFAYPEYDVSKLGVSLKVSRRGGTSFACPVQALSQTNARVARVGDWPTGDVAQVTPVHEGKDVFSLKALCLAAEAGVREVQFEYETSGERSGLENFIRTLSRQMGYGQAAERAAPKVEAAPGAPTLTKIFTSTDEFLRTFMGSMELGLLKVETKEKLARGTQVRIHASVAGNPAVRKIPLSGLIRNFANGVAEVELDEIPSALRERIEQIVGKLLEEETEASWQRRKEELTGRKSAAGAPPSAATTRFTMIAAGVVLVGGVIAILAMMARSPVPSPADAGAVAGKVLDAPRNETLTFTTSEGEVKVQSNDIRSIKLGDNAGTVRVKAVTKVFEIPPEQTANLSAFQKKQVEKLIALRNRK